MAAKNDRREIASSDYPMTEHARARAQQRAVSAPAIEAAIDYGRSVHTRGAVIYAIGRQEVRQAATWGIDLRSFEGVLVVCARDGEVITVYRNREFSRIRDGNGKSHPRRRAA
jgi:hypothetical protein